MLCPHVSKHFWVGFVQNVLNIASKLQKPVLAQEILPNHFSLHDLDTVKKWYVIVNDLARSLVLTTFWEKFPEHFSLKNTWGLGMKLMLGMFSRAMLEFDCGQSDWELLHFWIDTLCWSDIAQLHIVLFIVVFQSYSRHPVRNTIWTVAMSLQPNVSSWLSVCNLISIFSWLSLLVHSMHVLCCVWFAGNTMA